MGPLARVPWHTQPWGARASPVRPGLVCPGLPLCSLPCTGPFCFPSHSCFTEGPPACPRASDLAAVAPPGPIPLPRSSSFTVRASFSASSFSFFSSSLECFSSALAPAPMALAAGEETGSLGSSGWRDLQGQAHASLWPPWTPFWPQDWQPTGSPDLCRPSWGCLVGFGCWGYPRTNQRQGQVNPAQPPALVIRLAWPQSLKC